MQGLPALTRSGWPLPGPRVGISADIRDPAGTSGYAYLHDPGAGLIGVNGAKWCHCVYV
jgi:hypothetical protein